MVGGQHRTVPRQSCNHDDLRCDHASGPLARKDPGCELAFEPSGGHTLKPCSHEIEPVHEFDGFLSSLRRTKKGAGLTNLQLRVRLECRVRIRCHSAGLD